ncbi:MAG: outer membrane lipoprotein-sorting protein [Myxococcales bacterium]|nr:outer membrane lipoprotein-sorting protein [Myxococcales bacterium]
MKRRIVYLLAALLVPASLQAMTPQEILVKVDKSINNFKDQTMEIELEFIESKNAKRSLLLTMLQKGTEKRIVRFRSGTEKGQALLTLGPNQMFVYLPTYRKVRRVAAHVKNQGFMGSDLTMEDISTAAYAPSYTAKQIGETPEAYILELYPKDKGSTDWKKLKVWVSKAIFGFVRMEYYDKQDRHRKTWVRKSYKKVGNCYMAFWSKMTDHNRKHSTVMKIISAKTDSDLPDSLFTKKGLIRGR